MVQLSGRPRGPADRRYVRSLRVAWRGGGEASGWRGHHEVAHLTIVAQLMAERGTNTGTAGSPENPNSPKSDDRSRDV